MEKINENIDIVKIINEIDKLKQHVFYMFIFLIIILIIVISNILMLL